MDSTKPQPQIQEELKTLLQKKLIIPGSPQAEQDSLFHQSLLNWLEFAQTHAATNSRNYFTGNKETSRLQALRVSFQGIKEPVGKWALAVSTVTAAVVAVSSFGDFGHNIWVKGIIIAVEFLALAVAGFVAFQSASVAADLRLRRYGQSWVRHTVTAGRYWQEIYLFVYDLKPYHQAALEEDKKLLFQERIMEIYGDNLNRFAANMKDLDEYVNMP